MRQPPRRRSAEGRHGRLWPLALLVVSLCGCASSTPTPPSPTVAPASPAGGQDPASQEPPAATTAAEPSAGDETPAAAEDTATAPTAQRRPHVTVEKLPEESRLRDLCRLQEVSEEAGLEKSRRLLYETMCSAGLWFDGMLGGEPDVDSARRIHGRLEGIATYSDYWGTDFKGRLRLRYDLPNLKHRFAIFLGRDDPGEAIEDRREVLPIQSALLELEGEEEWLAGFGYRPPGRSLRKLDFRVGVKVQSETEVFFQSRWRTTLFVGQKSAWRFRETLFWQNRDGFGLTSSVDFNRILRNDLLLRWANIGTFSEATDGVRWRTSLILYQNLRKQRGMAYETFLRGETRNVEPLREFGARAIYRFPSKRRKWLFGELIAGWTFPRGADDRGRQSSPLVGFGVDILFGPDPY